MTVYTDKDAKHDFDSLLEDARSHGEVRIKREDGQEFSLRAVGELSQSQAPIAESARKRDLSDLVGSWVDDPSFDEAMTDQEQVDPALWK